MHFGRRLIAVWRLFGGLFAFPGVWRLDCTSPPALLNVFPRSGSRWPSVLGLEAMEVVAEGLDDAVLGRPRQQR